MNILRVTYFALGASIFAASCSKEAAEQDVYDWAEGEIYFKTSLANLVSSRGEDMTLDALQSFQVTCFNSTEICDAEGSLPPYFENATFIRNVDSKHTTYVSSPAEGPRDWPNDSGILRFFAFSPSLAVMADGNTAYADSEALSLKNSSIKEGPSAKVGYRLNSVRVNPDISRQYDLITAEASGERFKDFGAGVELEFAHQLCQIELRAWGASEEYDFEIAGVRIGNPTVGGDFIFADDTNPEIAGKWALTENPIRDKVEYHYGNRTSGEGLEATSTDKIYRINRTEHRTQASAATIMGHGGCAMVLPTVNARWEGSEDPNGTVSPYHTDRMYFSILLRVSDPETGSTLYPYPGNPYGMKVMSYATDSEGNIIKPLYAGGEGKYFTDPELEHPYEETEGTAIKDFGWAAIPVDADWSAGKRYVYTLDYTEGIGLHDPEDPEPGKPIVGQTAISWGVSVEEWDYAIKDENYDPDIKVP